MDVHTDDSVSTMHHMEPLVCIRRLRWAVLRRPQNRGPVSEQIWHDKDPSLLKDHKPRAKSKIAVLHRQ